MKISLLLSIAAFLVYWGPGFLFAADGTTWVTILNEPFTTDFVPCDMGIFDPDFVSTPACRNASSLTSPGWVTQGMPTWDDVEFQGSRRLWMMGTCAPNRMTNGQQLWGCESAATPGFTTYPANMEAWATYGPFDLTDAVDAELSFDYSFNKERVFSSTLGDRFGYFVSIDGIHFAGFNFLGESSSGWQNLTKSLKPWNDEVGDLTGQSKVWIAFIFEADATVQQGFGAMIDNVVIRKLVPGTDPVLSHEVYLAHFGDGEAGGASISSLVNILNLADEIANVEVRIRNESGGPLSIDLNGAAVPGMLEISIPSQGTAALKTDGLGPVRVGSVLLKSDQEIKGFIIFGGSIGEAGVLQRERGKKFVAPIEPSSGVLIGLALMGLEEGAVIQLELRDRDGNSVASATFNLLADGHAARFLQEILWSPPVDFMTFAGSLVMESTEDFVALLLRQGVAELSTMPVVNLGGAE